MADYTLHRRRFGNGRLLRLIPERKDQPELLDQGVGSNGDVRANLQEMWRINRYLGGASALTRHLFPLLRKHTHPLHIVDIGTGAGEMACLIARWAQRHHREISVYPLDLSARNLAIASEQSAQNMHLVQADAGNLPFAFDSVDYYFSTLFLHHLSPEQIIDLLRQTYQRAQYGIVMSDLVRGYLPMLAFRMIQPIFARNYLTRHDGLISIRRAYTPKELFTMAQFAGIEAVRVYEHFPWRMTLIAEKSRV